MLRRATLITILLVGGLATGCQGDESSNEALCAAAADVDDAFSDYQRSDDERVRAFAAGLDKVQAEMPSRVLFGDDVIDGLDELRDATIGAEDPRDLARELQLLDGAESMQPLADYMAESCPPTYEEGASEAVFCDHIAGHAEVEDDVLEAEWSATLGEIGQPSAMTATERDGFAVRVRMGTAPQKVFDFVNPYDPSSLSDAEEGALDAYSDYVEETC